MTTDRLSPFPKRSIPTRQWPPIPTRLVLPTRRKVFISYSHLDEKEVQEFIDRFNGPNGVFIAKALGVDAIQKWECFDADSGKDLAIELREYYIPDFSNWNDQGAFDAEFAKLLRDLKAKDAELR